MPIDDLQWESAMQNLLFASCLMFLLSLVMAAPVDVKGGRGNGRGRASSGSGQGGGAKWSADGEDLLVEKKDRPAKNEDEGETPQVRNKKQKQLAIEQRHLEKRIAQAQRLREIATRNGNQNLVASADRMEAEAISHYAQRVEHLEKFGVIDPALDPDGAIDPTPPPNTPTPARAPTPAMVTDPALVSGGTMTEPSAGPQLRSVLVKRPRP
jgi:hypothetical protein